MGRFTTSTKPWLDGYDTVRNRFKEDKTVDEGRNNTAVGRALYNLKKTLPPVTKNHANAFIKQQKSRLISSTVNHSPMLSQFMNTT